MEELINQLESLATYRDKLDAIQAVWRTLSGEEKVNALGLLYYRLNCAERDEFEKENGMQ